MTSRPVFQNISPLDHRYSEQERDIFDALVPFLSEEAAVAACVRAESALILAHLDGRGGADGETAAALDKLAAKITPEEVYIEEGRTHHFIRALVNVIRRNVPPQAEALVHLGATSADILDTALAWRIKAAMLEAVLPLLKKLVLRLCDIASAESETPQVGRTHGQHAVPITAGFAFAEFAARLGKCVREIEMRSNDLRGKLSGAAGAYNATSLISEDALELERRFCAKMGLEASEYSTQLVEPEYLLRLLLEMNIAFGIIANLADNLRNLQRSEIGELREGFKDAQVGSSTMPQKRNPWNSEHIKSLWKAFFPRVTTFFLDQISEHQRDLTGSASQRFIAEYITGFAMALRRSIFVLEDIKIDRNKMAQNFNLGGIADGIMAESAYILLAANRLNSKDFYKNKLDAANGAHDSAEYSAHEVIRRVTLEAEKEGISFTKALERESPVINAIETELRKRHLINENESAADFFSHPERCRGLAAEKARAIAGKYSREVSKNIAHNMPCKG